VKNVRLNDVSITGADVIGSVAGYNRGLIESCYVTDATVTGVTSTGGVSGTNFNGTVKNCFVNKVIISGTTNVGGLTGANETGSTVQSCFAIDGAVNSSTAAAAQYGGGITGINNGGTVENCYATVNVRGNSVGGITGNNSNSGIVRHCYAIGDVTSIGSGYYAGGVAGYNNGGTIQYCVALNLLVTSSVNVSSNIARIVGVSEGSGANLNNNYARTDMTLQYNFNGSAGTNVTVAAGPTNKHGADATSANYHDGAWWSGTLTFNAASWSLANGRLPWLEGFTGITQNPKVKTNEGDGTAGNPYKVATRADLLNVGRSATGWTVGAHYEQIADIDLGGVVWSTIGSNSVLFTGSYNGGGFTIYNLAITGSSSYQGLFANIGAAGVVKNIRLTGVDITITGANDYVGSIAGQNAGTVESCHVSNINVSGRNYMGGVAGNNTGTVTSCYVNNATITGSGNDIGGVAGRNALTVRYCYASGITVSGDSNVGGIAGNLNVNAATVQNCFAVGGTVTASIAITPRFAGGIAGSNTGVVENCYTTVNVVGNRAGGVVGANNYQVRNCYATGSIAATGTANLTPRAGGLVAENNSGGSMQNNVALNKSATTTHTSPTAGRVAGYNAGTLTGNYARLDMVVQYNNGVNITPVNDPTGIHGGDASATDYHSGGWWSGTVGGGFNTSAWSLASGRLPWLNGFPGITQSPAVTGSIGTPDNPILVATTADLVKVGKDPANGWTLSACYVQTASINLGGVYDWEPIGTNTAGSQFTGSYDGADFAINNFTSQHTTANYRGLFGYIGTGGVVKNLRMNNVAVAGADYVGGVTGYNNGTIESCHVNNASVTGNNNVGGIAGQNNATVKQCYVNVNTTGIRGNNYVGGVTGINGNVSGVIVQNCIAVGDTVAAATGSVNVYAGGISGYNYTSVIENCYITVNVKGYTAGGVAGYNGGTVRHCYITGSIAASGSSGARAGGVVGNQANSGAVQNNVALNKSVVTSTGTSASVGRITGNNPGAGSTLTGNYARIDMTVQHTFNGVYGVHSDVAPNIAGQHGADITSDDYYAASWWSGSAVNFNLPSWLPVNNRLPWLAGFPDVNQNPTVTPNPGDGSTAYPFKVANATDLGKIGNTAVGWPLSYHYLQTADINLNNAEWAPIANNSPTSNRLTGSYNGDDFIIRNLSITGNVDYRGLFGFIGVGGLVRNVRLQQVNITGKDYLGAIAGYNYGTIQNCSVTDETITGSNQHIGGITGYNNSNSAIIYCYVSNVSITGQTNVGGISGYNNSSSAMVQNCFAVNGTVTGGNPTGAYCYGGGISGNNSGGMIENCYSTVDVNGNRVGGITGNNTGTVQYCYSTGDIATTGGPTPYTGGVVGGNSGTASVRNCVALNKWVTTSATSATNVGRVAGYSTATLSANYAREDMSLRYNAAFPLGIITPVSDESGIHGADISSANYLSAGWWSGTATFNPTEWSLANGRLPWLNGFPGVTQNPTVVP
jgi:hypothetical protein